MVNWDDDLEHNSDNSMETLVRVGDHLGRRATDEQRQEYIANASNVTGEKNATITQLFTHFPARHSAK